MSGQLALTPVTDRDLKRLGVFAGERHDLADHLGREFGRRTAAGCIAQPRGHPGGCRRVEPPAAPVTDRLAPNPKLHGGLGNPNAGGGQQNDACPFRQFLWGRMRPHQIVQFTFMG